MTKQTRPPDSLRHVSCIKRARLIELEMFRVAPRVSEKPGASCNARGRRNGLKRVVVCSCLPSVYCVCIHRVRARLACLPKEVCTCSIHTVSRHRPSHGHTTCFCTPSLQRVEGGMHTHMRTRARAHTRTHALCTTTARRARAHTDPDDKVDPIVHQRFEKVGVRVIPMPYTIIIKIQR